MATAYVPWMQLVQEANVHFQSGRLEDARQVLEPLLASPPDNVDALMLLGMVTRGLQQTSLAIEYFTRAHHLAPDNPHILNVYANTLAAAGDVATAMEKLRAVIAEQPDVLESYVNLALVANDAGLHDQAHEAVADGLHNFPNNGRLLAIEAMTFRNSGRVRDALAVFRLAIIAEPNRALTHRNYAATLMAAGAYDAAASEFAEAARLGLNDRETYLGWAAARLEQGDAKGAAEMYSNVLSVLPLDDDAARALTRIATEYQTGADAFGHYRAATHKFRKDLNAWLRWTAAAMAHNRFAEVQAVSSEALKYFPDATPLVAALCYAQGMLGDAESVQDNLSAVVQRSDGNPYRDLLVQVALKAGDAQLAAQEAEIMTERAPMEQSGWAYLATAWRMLGDKREYWLCDFDNLVGAQFLDAASNTAEVGGFTANVADALDALHNTIAAPGDQSLRGGTQTSGSLFDRQDPMVQALKERVKDRVQDYIDRLPDDPDHPFLQRKSSRFRFAGSWSVRLKSQGHHVPHFHGQGWISSAYYARLPDSLGTDKENAAGWIGFGQPPEIYGLDQRPRKLVQPQEGLLVLFPSYMWHGTVPFIGDQYRLTAAFDVIPN